MPSRQLFRFHLSASGKDHNRCFCLSISSCIVKLCNFVCCFNACCIVQRKGIQSLHSFLNDSGSLTRVWCRNRIAQSNIVQEISHCRVIRRSFSGYEEESGQILVFRYGKIAGVVMPVGVAIFKMSIWFHYRKLSLSVHCQIAEIGRRNCQSVITVQETPWFVVVISTISTSWNSLFTSLT